MKLLTLVIMIIQLSLIIFYSYKIHAGTIITIDAVMLGITITSLFISLINITND